MKLNDLPPRERQVAEAVHRLVEASSAEICQEVGNGVSVSAVKTMLIRLEAKQIVTRRKSVGRVSFSPATVTDQVRRIAVERVTHLYFGGSIERLIQCFEQQFKNSYMSPEPNVGCE